MPISSPAGWPEELLPVFERAVTCEYASLTRKEAPVTWALNPYLGEDYRTLDVSTGLTYPAKAERARRNPKVALLFSDPVGSGIVDMPQVLVQGLATIRDADLQAGADRYARLALNKYPSAYKRVPPALLRRQQWYFTRSWILVTPLRILWWPGGETDKQPHMWQAPEGTTAPPSDPEPEGPPPGAWQAPPQDWRSLAETAIRYLGLPVITVVDERGWPVPFRASAVSLEQEGFQLKLGAGMPAPATGPACLTFHVHADVFTGQQNTTFVGVASERGGQVFFQAERVLPDFSLPGNAVRSGLAFFSAARKLAPRLKREAARRGQPVPRVNLPES